jgi:broad specificity phosphatase PhoE
VTGGSGGQAAGPAPERTAGWGPPRRLATTTLLLRHGQTALSAERRFAGRGDIPLTEEGRRQAAAAAARLSARGAIDLVLCSPLARARQTAETVARATGAALMADEDLVETDFGDWEGLTFAEVMARWPAELAAWTEDTEAAPPSGESLAAAARRALTALDRMLAEHDGKTLVVVSHVTPIKTFVCRALLAPPAALFRMHLDVGALSEVDWFSDGPALVRSLNDTAHLRSDAVPRTRDERPAG